MPFNVVRPDTVEDVCVVFYGKGEAVVTCDAGFPNSTTPLSLFPSIFLIRRDG